MKKCFKKYSQNGKYRLCEVPPDIHPAILDSLKPWWKRFHWRMPKNRACQKSEVTVLASGDMPLLPPAAVNCCLSVQHENDVITVICALYKLRVHVWQSLQRFRGWLLLTKSKTPPPAENFLCPKSPWGPRDYGQIFAITHSHTLSLWPMVLTALLPSGAPWLCPNFYHPLIHFSSLLMMTTHVRNPCGTHQLTMICTDSTDTKVWSYVRPVICFLRM